MKADTVTKDYMKDTEVFADVFNYYIYGGQQVIDPEKLTERDAVEIALPYGTDGKAAPVQRYRDVQKLYAAMTDGNAEYVLYGVENQTEIHYAMAVKNNLYDALDYAGQVEAIAKEHRKSRKQKLKQLKEGVTGKKPEQSAEEVSGKKQEEFSEKVLEKRPNAGEFLGGFWKEDRLMSDEEILRFQSSLREVMLFIKYAKDKDKLDEILKTNELRFQNVELRYEEGEEKVDMCQAIQDMRRESEEIGEMRGKEIGKEIGEKIGEKQGELKTARKNAQNFYRLGLGIEIIAEGVGYDLDTVKEWLNL